MTLAARSESRTDHSDDVRVESLVRDHLPLVGHIVRECLGRVPSHVSRDELVSAAMFALTASAKSYDGSRGVPFGAFAAIRIRGAIADELRGLDWASRGIRGKAREIDEIRGRLAATLGRTPTRDEIASVMGMTARELDGVEADVRRASVLSLQALTPQDSDELIPSAGEDPEGLLLRREQLGYLRDAIAELPDRLRTVVQGHFFDQRKMSDLAAELGVTESRISQLRSEALSLIREAMAALDTTNSPRTEPVRGRAATRAAYCAAVASRSTLVSRLQATTALGETRTNPLAELQLAT